MKIVISPEMPTYSGGLGILALDMARYNVRSNCISPFAWSRMVGSIPDSPQQEARLATLRKLTPDKTANVAVFLASDDARFMTGQHLTLDGGYVMDGSLPDNAV